MDNGSILHRPLGQIAFASIDFESAGAAPGETDQPVQVGVMRTERIEWDPVEEPPFLFDSYIACSHPIRWSAAKVHGITTERLKGAPDLVQLWPTLRTLLGRGAVVVGHNPATELRFLRAFPGHGFGPWLDTLALARKVLPGLADYSLSTVCDALGITPNLRSLVPRRWHDALFDAAGSLFVLRAIIQGLSMQEQPLETLDFALKNDR